MNYLEQRAHIPGEMPGYVRHRVDRDKALRSLASVMIAMAARYFTQPAQEHQEISGYIGFSSAEGDAFAFLTGPEFHIWMELATSNSDTISALEFAARIIRARYPSADVEGIVQCREGRWNPAGRRRMLRLIHRDLAYLERALRTTHSKDVNLGEQTTDGWCLKHPQQAHDICMEIGLLGKCKYCLRPMPKDGDDTCAMCQARLG